MTAFTQNANTFFSPTRGDEIYRKIRNPANRYELKAKRLLERMWLTCSKFVDEDAQERAWKDDFYAVWWELFLAYALTQAGVPLIPHGERQNRGKGNPDLLAANPSIWIEAVMPHPGTGSDALVEPPIGQAYSVPTEAFILRLRTAIEEKSAKIRKYFRDGTIPNGQPAIIAVSGARLPFRFSEPPIPTIVRSVCAVGSPVIEISLKMNKRVGGGVEFRDHVVKQSKAKVSTNLFLQKESAHVSAILYSASDCVNYPRRPGADFVLVHNPQATVPIPDNWLPIGEQYWIDGDKLRRDVARRRT